MHLISPGGKALIRRRSGRGGWGYKRLVGACVNYPLAPGGEGGSLDVNSKAGSPSKPAEARMRTKVASILVLLNLLGTTWGVTRKKSDIKLKWLEDVEHDGKMFPHMKITFADGTMDEIFLKPNPNCFFHGRLKTDNESTVVVDGCKNDDATILINSRLVPCGYVSLLFENGETYSIDPSEGRESLNGTDSVPPPQAAAFQGAGWQHHWLPSSVVAKVHVKYDRSLVNQYGSQAKALRGVQAIVHFARAWFHRSSGLAMDVQIQVLSWEYYAGTIPHPGIRGALGSLTGKGDGHPVVWFRSCPPGCSGTIGVGHVGAFCWPKKYNPGKFVTLFFCFNSNFFAGQITNVKAGADETAFNAQTFAHELGHNLGMR